MVAIGSYVLAEDNLYVGKIVDSDGYVNVRKEASTKSQIVSVINEGEEFIYEYDEKSNWYRVYNKEDNNWIGYIYKSKVKSIREYTTEEISGNTESSSNTKSSPSTMEIILFLLIVAIVITIYVVAYKNVKAEKMFVITGTADIIIMICVFILFIIAMFRGSDAIIFICLGALFMVISYILTITANIKMKCSIPLHICALLAKTLLYAVAILGIFAFMGRRTTNKYGVEHDNKLAYGCLFAAGFLILGLLPKGSLKEKMKNKVSDTKDTYKSL